MNNLSGKILALVLSLFLVVYVGYQAFRYFYSPIKTETAQESVINDTVYAQGIIIRDEIPVTGISAGVISYYYDDGVRVITGTPVAEVHIDRQNVKRKHQIEDIDDAIARLKEVEASAVGVADVEGISTEIDEQIHNLVKMNDSGNLESAGEVQNGLQDVLNQKAVAIREVTDFSIKIEEMEAEKMRLENQLSLNISQITSPGYGYFGSYCDTASQIISTEMLETATVAQLEELTAAQYAQDTAYAGKVIAGYDWHYTALVSEEEAKKFSVGQWAELYFGSVGSQMVPGEVTQIIQDETSRKTAVVFTCNYMSDTISRMRNPSVRIELGTYRGLKISYRALRFQDDVQGVYVIANQALEFKEVDIIYEGVGFFISRIDSNKDELVQLYDDVVTEGTDLYEGKAIYS